MKIKNGYSIILQNNAYAVYYNGAPLNKTLHLTEIGAFLWSLLEKEDLSTPQMLDKLLNEFEISTVLALGEIDTLLKIIKENDFAQ